jgi:hypothetical protein
MSRADIVYITTRRPSPTVFALLFLTAVYKVLPLLLYSKITTVNMTQTETDAIIEVVALAADPSSILPEESVLGISLRGIEAPSPVDPEPEESLLEDSAALATRPSGRLFRGFSQRLSSFRRRRSSTESKKLIDGENQGSPVLQGADPIPRPSAGSRRNPSRTRSVSTPPESPLSGPSTPLPTLCEPEDPKAREKRLLTRKDIGQALSHLATVSAAAEAVVANLESTIQSYGAWRRDNGILLWAGGTAIPPNHTCGPCDLRAAEETVTYKQGGERNFFPKVKKALDKNGVGLAEEEQEILRAWRMRELLRREKYTTTATTAEPGTLDWIEGLVIFDDDEEYTPSPPLPVVPSKGKGRLPLGEPLDETSVSPLAPPPSPRAAPATVDNTCPESKRRCERCVIPRRCRLLRTLPKPKRYTEPVDTMSFPKVGSTSVRCASGPRNDIYHLKMTHLALYHTMQRLLSTSGLVRQRAVLKLAHRVLSRVHPALVNGMEDIRGVAGYWLDYDRVYKDWGWVWCNHPESLFRPETPVWETVTELCTLEVRKAEKHGLGDTLDQYGPRIYHLGGRIEEQDFRLARGEEHDRGLLIQWDRMALQSTIAMQMNKELTGYMDSERAGSSGSSAANLEAVWKETGVLVGQCTKVVLGRTKTVRNKLLG